MTHLTYFLLLGITSAFVTCATDRGLTSFGTALWRSWLIASFAVYVSSIVGVFVQDGFQMPAGPENVVAVFILLPLRVLLGSAIVTQPLLFITIMIGLVVCLPLAQLIFSLLGDSTVASSDMTSGSSKKLSMSRGSLIFSILVVAIGYAVLTVKASQEAKPFQTPSTAKLDLWNFRNLEMTEFSCNDSSYRNRSGDSYVNSLRGTCGLTDKAVQALMEKYDWQNDTLSKSDNEFLAETFSECVSSPEFDKTFEQNPKCRFGNALLDREKKLLYFEVSSHEIPRFWLHC